MEGGGGGGGVSYLCIFRFPMIKTERLKLKYALFILYSGSIHFTSARFTTLMLPVIDDITKRYTYMCC